MRLAISAALVAALSLSVGAQTTGVAGTNDLVINGFGSGTTSLYANTGISAAASSLTFNVSANPSAALIGAFSPAGAVGSLPLSAGYSVDINLLSATIWLDGSQTVGFPISTIVPASGTWSLTAPVSLAPGAPYAFQFGILDPGFAGGIGVTQAHAGAVSNTQTTSYTLGDDTSVAHSLIAPILFYGVAQPTLNVGSNGQLTFAVGSGDFTSTTAEFFAGWQVGPTVTPNPGVAVHWSDLNNGGTLSGATYDVIEDLSTGSATVAFVNQKHWSSADPAGTFTCTFDAVNNAVAFDFTSHLPGLTATESPLIGVSDGDDTVGTSTDLSDGFGTGLVANFGYTSPNPADSICEVMPANTAFGSTTYTFTDLASDGTWFITN